MTATAPSPLPLVVTMGEPAGIGGDLTLKAWLTDKTLPPFAAIDDADRLAALARRLGYNVPIQGIAHPREAAGVFGAALPVLHRPLPAPVTPGTPEPRNAPRVIAAIDEAVDFALRGEASAVVTQPINKAVLYAAGFSAPGHTEYLAEIVARRKGAPVALPVMMLAAGDLRVVPLTVHLPLKDVPAALNADKICAVTRIAARALQTDFALPAPRLAVAALNPHGGEEGALGREESDIIAPACDLLRAEGWNVSGPLPADTLFHAEARARHDAVICMYHDQALIPLKTVDLWGGVNVTLGLDIVRTSPDHGTAFALAGTGKADARSVIAALRMAASLASARAR